MKKEIKKLLESDNGLLYINEAFYLDRWSLHKETDVIGREEEHLALVFQPTPGSYKYFYKEDIKSRDIKGILGEMNILTEQMLNRYADSLIKQLNGGNWGTLKILDK